MHRPRRTGDADPRDQLPGGPPTNSPTEPHECAAVGAPASPGKQAIALPLPATKAGGSGATLHYRSFSVGGNRAAIGRATRAEAPRDALMRAAPSAELGADPSGPPPPRRTAHTRRSPAPRTYRRRRSSWRGTSPQSRRRPGSFPIESADPRGVSPARTSALRVSSNASCRTESATTMTLEPTSNDFSSASRSLGVKSII
jgi:hypothetical protein